MNKKGLFSHQTDHWRTPLDIYYYFIHRKNCADPCPFQSEENNLNKTYDTRLFINPPYSDIKNWVEFIKRNLYTANEIYLLIPARTDTRYFHELMQLEDCIITLYFIKGRLRFNESKKSAPFPSVLIKFNRSPMTALFVHFIEKEDIFRC